MKTHHYFLTAVTLVSGFMLSGLAYSASSASSASSSSGWHHEEHKHSPFDGLLNLTDAQKKTLQEAHAKENPSARELGKQIQTAHEALDKAGENNADDAALNQLAGDFAKLIAQKEINRVKTHQLLLSILTPEQKQILTKWESEHKHNFSEPHNFHS